MILFYMPLLALIHFGSGTALGGLLALAVKAIADMRRQDRAG